LNRTRLGPVLQKPEGGFRATPSRDPVRRSHQHSDQLQVSSVVPVCESDPVITNDVLPDETRCGDLAPDNLMDDFGWPGVT
ncbi:hypothetical protein, partial [Streptomyces syringium]|uniref:hypothetical protein n=1 Tax=Streptomyces syringium TaxID=76729 RepID=UPI0033D72026